MEQKNIIAALVKAQLEIRPPARNGMNPMFKSKYATLDDILNSARLPLANNGLILTYTVVKKEENFYAVANLLHCSGEMISSEFPMVIEKQTNQGIASARTYACRYAACNLLALPSDEDDDGNATLTDSQTHELEQATNYDEVLADRILKGYERKYKKPVKSFSDIKQKDFLPAINALKKNPQPIHRNA